MNKYSTSDYHHAEDVEESYSTYEKKQSELNSKKISKFEVTSNLWILASIVGGFFFALNNFFIGKASFYGFYARMFVGVGNLLQ